MQVNPRLMDRRVEIWDPTNMKENTLGALVPDPIKVATVWASVLPTRGREYYEAQKARSELSYKVGIRYREDINPAMVIKYKNKELSIEAVIEIGRQEGLELMCLEKRVSPNG